MSGFNFSLNSTPNNISKLNTAAATSTPFNFGSSGSLSSTPATNLFGNVKSNANSSLSFGSVQNNAIGSSSASTVSGGCLNGLNFSKDQKNSSNTNSSAVESKPLTNNGQSLFSSSSLTTIGSNKPNLSTAPSSSITPSLSSLATSRSSGTVPESLDSNRTLSNSGSGLVNLNSNDSTKIDSQKIQNSTSSISSNISNTLNATNNFNFNINCKSNELSSLNTENKQKRGAGFELHSSNVQSTVNNSSCTTNSINDSKQNSNQAISGAGTLPNVLSFNVPSLNSTFQESKSNSETKGVGLGGTSSLRTNSTLTNSSQVNKSMNNQTKQMGIKDQHIPQILMECIEQFKKNLEEMRKVKELNSTYTSKIIHKNIHEILAMKQCLIQSQTEFQRNLNEVANLKENIIQELRNVDICDHLKDMPLGLQYDCDIWNEYFMSRVRLFQNKLRNLKNQFEQLEGYFSVHDQENIIESQRIVETLKASHKNLLNEAAMLKIVHEKVAQLKANFLTYRKNWIGDSTDIFENYQNENSTVYLTNSSIKM